jgi:pimeloyl-ACP methyl ester carboxylesterase
MAPLTTMCLEQGLSAFEAQIEALLSRPALEDFLPTLSMPVLSCTGALDAWSPPQQAQAIADAIPGATLAIVPEAGHFCPLKGRKPSTTSSRTGSTSLPDQHATFAARLTPRREE